MAEASGLKHEAARRAQREKETRQEQQAQKAAASKAAPKIGAHMDIPMLTIVILLLLFGLVMLFSASYPSGYLRYGDSYHFISDQLKFAAIGVAAMLFASRVNYQVLKKMAWPLMVASLVLLLVALFMPAQNGAHRWIWLNPGDKSMGFQPSEIVKFALILVFAKMISANQSRIKTFQYGFLPFVLVLGVTAVLLILEPHLSCTILVIGIGIAMMITGGVPIRYFVIGGGILLALLGIVLLLIPEAVPYATSRIDGWLASLMSPANAPHQTKQSLIAVGSGGLFGKGIGSSVQKFLYLPEVYNDYIYAIICEELGMVGALAVLLLFVALLVRGIFIGLRARDRFGAMLAIGITVQIALQALLHVAVNLNAIPSTGISLPFFSYGGTSLCMLLGQVGILLAVSRKARLARGRTKQQQEEDEAALLALQRAGRPYEDQEAVGV